MKWSTDPGLARSRGIFWVWWRRVPGHAGRQAQRWRACPGQPQQIDLPNRSIDLDGSHRTLDSFTTAARTQYLLHVIRRPHHAVAAWARASPAVVAWPLAVVWHGGAGVYRQVRADQ